MIINDKSLLALAPIKDMLDHKVRGELSSHGLTEAGYDIRLAQDIHFSGNSGRFVLASAIEEFQMPDSLVGVVHDKSTWARYGLSVFNTIIEPAWTGFLTLELVYHGHQDLVLPKGTGIAQVIFHEVKHPAEYKGKYQNQANEPIEARH